MGKSQFFYNDRKINKTGGFADLLCEPPANETELDTRPNQAKPIRSKSRVVITPSTTIP